MLVSRLQDGIAVEFPEYVTREQALTRWSWRAR
jgi:hypothetical protein